MNNLDYLEYEGSRLLDYAMKTYSKASTGSLVNDIERAVLAGQKELSLAEQDALQSLSFEYTLYRLYIARGMIRHHKSGFGLHGCNPERSFQHAVFPAICTQNARPRA